MQTKFNQGIINSVSGETAINMFIGQTIQELPSASLEQGLQFGANLMNQLNNNVYSGISIGTWSPNFEETNLQLTPSDFIGGQSKNEEENSDNNEN